MKTLLLVPICLLAFLTTTDSLPRLQDRDDPKSILERRRRQSFSCMNQTQCLPPSLAAVTVPSDLVNCDQNVCVCRQCFQLNSSGTCYIPSACYTYSDTKRDCQDDRASQLTAMLLSLFLSEVGAANFYIGRNDLGAGQIVVFLLIFVASCVAVCPCCLFCCKDDDKKAGGAICFAIFLIISK